VQNSLKKMATAEQLASSEQFKETGHCRTAGTKWTGEQLKELARAE
jgi:hypothetical protein